MKNIFKKSVLFIGDKIPFLGGLIISFLRFLRFWLYYKPLFLWYSLHSDDNDPLKVYWVSPKKIKYFVNHKNVQLNNFQDRGKVIKGDWDISDIKITDNPTYKAIKDRFIDGKSWEGTELYRYGKKRIENGEVFRGAGTLKKLDQYFKFIDSLYESIKERGYIPNSKSYQLKEEFKADNYYREFDEVLISISRDGKPLLNDGRHRLMIAKILGLKKIPVMVVARHSKWAEFKNELKAYAERSGGNLYQPAYHFDLSDVPHTYGEDRFNLIKENTSIENGAVLDIGANFGYFCHQLEAEGFDCTAVEVNPQEVYFMKKLRDANEDKFKIVQESIFSFQKGEKIKYDVVLALYIFHHFLKREKTHNQLIDFLSRLECKEMFLGIHNPNEKGLKGAYKNYAPKEFVEFIITNSCLNNYKLIKEFKDSGRRLYKIYK